MGRIPPGPTRWPPGAERRLLPAKSNLKPQTFCAAQTHIYSPSKGFPWAQTGRALITPLFLSPLGYHAYLPSFNVADLWLRDLWCPIAVGASVGLVYQSITLLQITWAFTTHLFLLNVRILRGLP